MAEGSYLHWKSTGPIESCFEVNKKPPKIFVFLHIRKFLEALYLAEISFRFYNNTKKAKGKLSEGEASWINIFFLPDLTGGKERNF